MSVEIPSRVGPKLLQSASMSRKDERGSVITARVHSWSWVYPSDGLQLALELSDGSTAHVQNSQIPFTSAKIEDVRSMLENAKTMVCIGCNKRSAFDPRTVQTNQHGRCKPCHGTYTRYLAQCLSSL